MSVKLSHSYSALAQYEQCPLRYYRQRIIKDIKDEGNAATQHGQRIHSYLEYRLKEDKWLPKDYRHYEPLCKAMESLAEGGELHVEYEAVLTNKLKPTTWWAKDAWLRGKFDVFIIKDNSAVVCDWKTGKRRPDPLQMQIFAAQAFAIHPTLDTVRTMFVWLNSMESDKETFYREKQPELWQEILGRIKRIENSLAKDNWPARPSGLCNWCPAKATCDFAQ